MVRLTRIYTRTGDDGTTGLADGSRRPKYDLRLESYGTVDELNSALGMPARICRTHCGSTHQIVGQLLSRIQNDLFDVGADLANPSGSGGLRVTELQVRSLEEAIDRHNAELVELESFVLPGGSELACWLHIARTVCRRAERLVSHLLREEAIGPFVLPYLNRLSDLLFVLARVANSGAEGDVLWRPGAHGTSNAPRAETP
jgi:cob(I)alamin adenosyltransferase